MLIGNSTLAWHGNIMSPTDVKFAYEKQAVILLENLICLLQGISSILHIKLDVSLFYRGTLCPLDK